MQVAQGPSPTRRKRGTAWRPPPRLPAVREAAARGPVVQGKISRPFRQRRSGDPVEKRPRRLRPGPVQGLSRASQRPGRRQRSARLHGIARSAHRGTRPPLRVAGRCRIKRLASPSPAARPAAAATARSQAPRGSSRPAARPPARGLLVPPARSAWSSTHDFIRNHCGHRSLAPYDRRLRGGSATVPDDAERPRIHQARPDPSLEDALRQFGADILDEPIPERMLRALQDHRSNANAESSQPSHPSRLHRQ